MKELGSLKILLINLLKKWEFAWDKLIKENIAIATFVKQTDIRLALKPRYALYGCPINAAKRPK